MKIKMLAKHLDLTVGKVYDAEVDEGGNFVYFFDNIGRKRSMYYPNNPAYKVVADDAVDEPEQLTLRDLFAISVIPPDDMITSVERAAYRYTEADAMMDARKK